MHSGIVAVWDDDREYAVKLSDYLRRQGGLGAAVVCFEDWQRLSKAAEAGQVAVALLGGSVPEETEKWQVPILRLTENRAEVQVRYDPVQPTDILSDPVRRPRPLPDLVQIGTTKEVCVYKYQPAREILRVVLQLQEQVTAMQMTAAGTAGGCRMARIRGIYTPLGGCLKTSLGLVMGCILAEKQRCLFLCLEAHSGFRTLFDRQYPMDLSDVFAGIRRGEDVTGRLHQVLQSFGKLLYIPPVIWPVDIREAEFTELKELLQRLALCGQFDEIVLDVGTDLARPEKVLSWCDRIYQPEKEDVFSRAKLAEYECYLRVSGYEGLAERTCRVPLSSLGPAMDGMALDQWQRWERLIPAVRRLLEEDGHGE